MAGTLCPVVSDPVEILREQVQSLRHILQSQLPRSNSSVCDRSSSVSRRKGSDLCFLKNISLYDGFISSRPRNG